MITKMQHIQIGSDVRFNREDAYTFEGVVLGLDEIQQRALVQWIDGFGQHRQMMVGVEFLSIKQTAAELVGQTAAVA